MALVVRSDMNDWSLELLECYGSQQGDDENHIPLIDQETLTFGILLEINDICDGVPWCLLWYPKIWEDTCTFLKWH